MRRWSDPARVNLGGLVSTSIICNEMEDRLPAKRAVTKASEPELPDRRPRRRRGEARAELTESASELFNERGYADTSTREIAERASVSETLIFRYFGSKAGLFRESVVQPFLDFVDEFAESSAESSFEIQDDEEATRQFLGGLYDLFREHRGLVAMFFAAETMLSSELAESGVLNEVAARLQLLVEIGRKQMRIRHNVVLSRPALTTRVTLSMVAGMATFGPSFYGSRRASRAAIVEELTQAVLHGHQHRSS
jgi:AcrR family transcriptional regulator